MKSSIWSLLLMCIIRMSTGSKRVLAKWDLGDLGRILDHPQLIHGISSVSHTMSVENDRDTKRMSIRPPISSTRGHSYHPKRREGVTDGNRYVEYDERARRVTDIGQMASNMLREGDNTHASDQVGENGSSTLDLTDSSMKTLHPSATDDSHEQHPPLVEPRDSTMYQPIRIHFDVSEIYQWKDQDPIRVNYLITKVLPGLATVWSSALNVVPVASVLQIDYTWCPFGSPDNQAFTKGIPHSDLVVFVTANSAACDTGSTLATASSCYWDQYQRPIAGSIDFCLNTIDTKHLWSIEHTISRGGGDDEILPETYLTSEDPLLDRALLLSISAASHEFCHLLGATPEDLLYFYNSNTGTPRTPKPVETEVECVSGFKQLLPIPDEGTLQLRKDKYGETYYEVTLPTVTQVVRNHFDCQSLTGARLENQDDSHCFGSHFERRLFMDDDENPSMLTPLTLAMLQDSGWYLPNFRVAKITSWGHGAGCDFVEKECIVKGKVSDFFCSAIANLGNKTIEGEFGCGPGYLGIGVCDLVDYSELRGAMPPKKYQYFHDHPSLGAFMSEADYCPTYSIATVSCRHLSSSNEASIPTLSESTASMESRDRHARCFPTVKESRPVCLNATCDTQNRKIIIDAGADVLSCKQDGEIIDLKGVQIKCPPFAMLCPESICPANCAGRGICDFSSGTCLCADQKDESKGCFDTIVAVPPQYIRPVPAYSCAVSSYQKSILGSWIVVAGFFTFT